MIRCRSQQHTREFHAWRRRTVGVPSSITRPHDACILWSTPSVPTITAPRPDRPMDGGEADTGCGAGSANVRCPGSGASSTVLDAAAMRRSHGQWAPHIHVALRRGASPSRAHALGDAREVRPDTPDRARGFPFIFPRCPCPTVRARTRSQPKSSAPRGDRSFDRRLGGERSGGPGVVQPSRTCQRMNRRGAPDVRRAKAMRQQPPTSVSAEGVYHAPRSSAVQRLPPLHLHCGCRVQRSS